MAAPPDVVRAREKRLHGAFPATPGPLSGDRRRESQMSDA